MNALGRRISRTVPAFSVLASCAASHAALLDGKVMSADLLHTTAAGGPSAIVSSGDFVVGPDVELEGFGLHPSPPLPALVDVDISDTQILITLLINQPPAVEEVLRFIDSNNTIPHIRRVDINSATNWAGFTPNRVFTGGEAIDVNLSQLSGLQGQQILLDVIPEPAAGTLLLGAGLALAAARRRLRLV